MSESDHSLNQNTYYCIHSLSHPSWRRSSSVKDLQRHSSKVILFSSLFKDPAFTFPQVTRRLLLQKLLRTCCSKNNTSHDRLQNLDLRPHVSEVKEEGGMSFSLLGDSVDLSFFDENAMFLTWYFFQCTISLGIQSDLLAALLFSCTRSLSLSLALEILVRAYHVLHIICHNTNTVTLTEMSAW